MRYISTLALVAVLVAGIFAIQDYLSLPTVSFSNTTGDCVHITYPDGTRINCIIIPSRYHMEYVR